MKKVIIWLALVVTLLLAQTAWADLVTNGDFENVDLQTFTFPDWTMQPAQPGTVSAAWGTWFGALGPVNHGYFACVYGAGGTISQNLATTPGQSYLLNFYLWVDGQPPFYNPNRVTVQWGSDTVFDQFNVPGNPGGWSLLQVGVVASDPLTTLTLGGYNFQGPIFIDDVSVNPVPVPCTLVLLGSGLLPLLGWRRFRKS